MDPLYGDTTTSGDAVFDASQYAFFGNDVGEAIELGGLEDEELDAPLPDFEEEEFLFDRQEGVPEEPGSVSDTDDLSSSFFKLNSVSKSKDAGFLGGRVSREGSSVSELVKGEDISNWYTLPDDAQHSKRWSSQPYPSPAQFVDSKPLYRTSSYPDQQPHIEQNHHQISADLFLFPKTSYPTHHPTSGYSPQVSSNFNHLNPPYNPQSRPMVVSPSGMLPFSSSQFQFNGLPYGPLHQGSIGQYSSSNNARPLVQWVNRAGFFPGEHSNQLNNKGHHQNGLIPSHMLPQMHSPQQRLHNPVHPPLGMLPGIRPHLLNRHVSMPAQFSKRYEDNFDMSDLSDQKLVASLRHKHNVHTQGFNGHRYESNWPIFRSKYMTVDEIDTIVRIQLAATHSSDPYVEDYYHQAYLAKMFSGAKVKHHFCPTHVRDSHPCARTNNEQHAFLQVDGLGRVPFSSIRRPRLLLEVDAPNTSNDGISDQKSFEKPLEQEPMLAVRVIIEDALCILLEVDDVDRFLDFNQPPDGGNQLRHRRQSLLEEVTAFLQLVDPLSKSVQAVGLAPKDDLVFLRTVSIPKGRKLLAKYLQLILPGDDLCRVVCMAIFRHLRFLFGSIPSDLEAAESASTLASVVSECVRRMDLGSLSACLAAVVCSKKQPPLRPVGSSAGYGASLILLSVLERAAELMNDPHDTSSYAVADHSLWKASFNEYFILLIKYCINKYDSIMSSSLRDPAEAIKQELPFELLGASLPHANDEQKKILYDFTQRSIVDS